MGGLYRDRRLKYRNGLILNSEFPDLLIYCEIYLMWLLDSWLLTGIYISKNIAKIRGFEKIRQTPQVLRIIRCFLFSAHSSKTSPELPIF